MEAGNIKDLVQNHFELNLFLYNIIPDIKITADNNWDIRIGPSIKLSALMPSINILINPYPIKYKYVSCPVNFLFLPIFEIIKNNTKFATDS